MKLIPLALVLLVGVVLVYPPYAEQAPGLCAAFALRARALALARVQQQGEAAPPQLQALAAGTPAGLLLPDTYVRGFFAPLPATLGCALAYWWSLVDPDPAKLLTP